MQRASTERTGNPNVIFFIFSLSLFAAPHHVVYSLKLHHCAVFVCLFVCLNHLSNNENGFYLITGSKCKIIIIQKHDLRVNKPTIMNVECSREGLRCGVESHLTS